MYGIEPGTVEMMRSVAVVLTRIEPLYERDDSVGALCKSGHHNHELHKQENEMRNTDKVKHSCCGWSTPAIGGEPEVDLGVVGTTHDRRFDFLGRQRHCNRCIVEATRGADFGWGRKAVVERRVRIVTAAQRKPNHDHPNSNKLDLCIQSYLPIVGLVK